MNLLNSIIQGIEQLTPESLADMQQSLRMYANLEKVTSTFSLAILVMYLVYAVLNGLNWDFTNMLVNKKLKFPKYEAQFAVLAFIFLLPAMIIFRAILNSLIQLDFLYPMKIIAGLIILATWYFMMIAFALINKYKLNKLKQHLKQTFIIGCKKAKILIPTYLIIIVVLSAFFTLIYLVQDIESLSVLILSIVLFMLSIVWSRIYFLTTMKNLS
ncbi:hypothetical protein KY343_00600 [Candidatus Woesearchaeota archaeon]|nr:hypothetical protein [Candidatus Woesearchaeota archaeon]